MQNETFNAAKKLRDEIIELRKHRNYVFNIITRGNRHEGTEIDEIGFEIVLNSNNYSLEILRSKYMLIAKGRAVELYLESVDKAIAAKELEFLNLQDSD